MVTHHSFVRFPRTQVPETSRHPRAPDAGHPPPQPSPRLMQRRKSPINRAALRAQPRNHCSPEEPKVEPDLSLLFAPLFSLQQPEEPAAPQLTNLRLTLAPKLRLMSKAYAESPLWMPPPLRSLKATNALLSPDMRLQLVSKADCFGHGNLHVLVDGGRRAGLLPHERGASVIEQKFPLREEGRKLWRTP